MTAGIFPSHAMTQRARPLYSHGSVGQRGEERGVCTRIQRLITACSCRPSGPFNVSGFSALHVIDVKRDVIVYTKEIVDFVLC